MVVDPEIFNYLKDDSTIFEKESLMELVEEGQLMSYAHKGFWKCMDNVREKAMLDKLLASDTYYIVLKKIPVIFENSYYIVAPKSYHFYRITIEDFLMK